MPAGRAAAVGDFLPSFFLPSFYYRVFFFLSRGFSSATFSASGLYLVLPSFFIIDFCGGFHFLVVDFDGYLVLPSFFLLPSFLQFGDFLGVAVVVAEETRTKGGDETNIEAKETERRKRNKKKTTAGGGRFTPVTGPGPGASRRPGAPQQQQQQQKNPSPHVLT